MNLLHPDCDTGQQTNVAHLFTYKHRFARLIYGHDLILRLSPPVIDGIPECLVTPPCCRFQVKLQGGSREAGGFKRPSPRL